MNALPPSNKTELSTSVMILATLGALALGILLMAGGLLMQQTGAGSLTQALTGLFALNTTHTWWYISRAAGLMGYLLFWLSMIWGFAVSSKMFDSFLQRLFTFDFHEFLSLLSLGFVGLHAVVLLWDKFQPFSLAQVLIPFASSYRPLWVGLGIIGFYLAVLVTAAFYLRSRISMQAFRTIHYLSIASYLGALLHAVYSGTDSALPWVTAMYWGTFLTIVFSGVYWIASLTLKKLNGARPALEPARGR